MDYTVCICSQLLIMRYDYERLVHLVPQLEKECVQLFLVLGIEASGRLIG